MRVYNENQIDEIVKILNADGVISVPTDTVFGLCARINSIKAKENLMNAKNRPEFKRFPIMCANLEQIKKVAIVSETAERIIKEFMPGPITIILNKKEEVPDYVTNSSDTIAIRMATSEVLVELINKLGCPIFLSSANQSGEPVSKNLNEIEKNCPKISGMLDGNVKFGMSSTIVNCSEDKVEILRKGPIGLDEIIKVIQ